MTEVYFMSRAIRNSDQTTFDKVIRKMDKIADDIQLLSIVTTIFGAICFITSACLLCWHAPAFGQFLRWGWEALDLTKCVISHL